MDRTFGAGGQNKRALQLSYEKRRLFKLLQSEIYVSVTRSADDARILLVLLLYYFCVCPSSKSINQSPAKYPKAGDLLH